MVKPSLHKLKEQPILTFCLVYLSSIAGDLKWVGLHILEREFYCRHWQVSRPFLPVSSILWFFVKLGMPISAEQWRASVGGNNAAHSHALRKSLRRKFPCKSLLSQILSFLMTLLMGTSLTDGSMGKYVRN